MLTAVIIVGVLAWIGPYVLVDPAVAVMPSAAKLGVLFWTLAVDNRAPSTNTLSNFFSAPR
jgi:hypothetical protein